MIADTARGFGGDTDFGPTYRPLLVAIHTVAPCQVANPHVSPLTFTRVYTSGTARKAHLVRHSGELAAFCGRTSEFWGFFGTGSQDEYDRAAFLPTCIECERKASA